MSPPEIELSRWQGSTDARVDDAERRLDAVNGNIERVWQAIGKLDRTVAGIAARVAIASGIAALIGSAGAMVAVYFITRG